ncbi:RNA chaperone Hfq [Solibacillus sp. FSL H8-0538]|uniref:RNA chaperone Hfq n=1 Tax=Solibacillus sp. FSL H8-0538 TaxID=2921400 RepID=UPI0030F7437F
MKSINLQDTFLNYLRKNNIFLTVFLLNGFQLKGTIKSYDNFTVLLESDGKQQLIYKHAISTFVPSKQVVLAGEEDKFKPFVDIKG